jgi:hypothetical protein
MIRLGVLDFDTSHVTAFTARLNHVGVPREQWVDGARVVVGCPGTSRMMPERIPGYRKAMEKFGVPLVERPTDMIGRVDGMLIESQEGGVHFDRAKPFLEAGLPCFIDKPFTCSTADARKIFALSAKKKAPVFSASSLRYAPEVTGFLADAARGKVVGALAWGPAPYHGDARYNPGLYNYGIHVAEVLYALMGPGCTRVSTAHERDVDVVSGHWRDGRVATLRGIRNDRASGYGFVAFTDRGVRSVTVRTDHIYRELLKKIVEFFAKKEPPVAPAVTIEMMAYLEAANKSAANHGAVMKVEA